MYRAMRRFVSKITGPRKIVFFIVLTLICILALSIGIYTQFFYKYSATDPFLIGINLGAEKTKEEYALLEANFNGLFTNETKINSESLNVNKIQLNSDVVYTGYDIKNEDETYYSIDLKLPVININTSKVKEINQKIKTDFHEKANSYMRQKEMNVVYSVDYAAYINEQIISLVVKASLKEGDNPEKIIVKTYNYNIAEDKEVTFDDLIKCKGTTKEFVQTTINDEIKTAYDNAVIIADQFGVMYERDLKSEMYKVDNTECYFLTQDGYVYVVYSYGNKDYTNVVDIIIF